MKRALIFWMTGLSGAGKTTLVQRTVYRLRQLRRRCLVIDGDDVRRKLHRHLGFSRKDILLNNRLIAGLCQKNRQGYDAIFVPIISVRCAR
jgi:adenylylsulfate kinase-like enzyme